MHSHFPATLVIKAKKWNRPKHPPADGRKKNEHCTHTGVQVPATGKDAIFSVGAAWMDLEVVRLSESMYCMIALVIS